MFRNSDIPKPLSFNPQSVYKYCGRCARAHELLWTSRNFEGVSSITNLKNREILVSSPQEKFSIPSFELICV